MPRRTPNRSTCKRLPRYKGSATASQLVGGIRQHFVHGRSYRSAVAFVNARSGKLAKERLLSRCMLQRFCVALPVDLRLAEEIDLMQWLQVFESAQRTQLVARHRRKPGGRRLFTVVEEELLAQWMCVMASVNVGVGKAGVIERAHGLLLMRAKLTPAAARHFSELKLDGWYKGFVLRQPGIMQRKERHVIPGRLIAENQLGSIAHFFQLLSKFKEYTAAQIYAGDETGLTGDGTRPGLVWTQVGVKQVRSPKKRTQGHIGLMHIGNAEGKSCPPVVVYKSTFLTESHLTALPARSLVGTQENGHFIGKNFRSVLEHIMVHARQPGGVWDCAEEERKPLLFIVDGASSHTDMDAIEWARAQKLDIICLPSHTTHILQVADVSLFGPFKRYWAEMCKASMQTRRRELTGVAMATEIVVPTFVRAWEKAMTPSNVMAGFLRTGMFPFDPEAHKHFDVRRLGSLGGLPLLVSSKDDLLRAPSISALVQSCDDAVPATPAPKAKKQRTLRLNTESGVLLTGEDTIALLRAKQAEKEALVQEKAANRDAKAAKALATAATKAAKAVATVVTKAARALARTEKEAAKVAKAAASAHGEGEGKRRKAKGEAGVVDGGEAVVLGPALQPVFLSELALAAAMAAKGPGALEERQRKVEQRQRERAAAALLTVVAENETPVVAASAEAEDAGKGLKRKAAAEAAVTGKENTHGHNTRSKAARTEASESGPSKRVRRPLGAVLNRTM